MWLHADPANFMVEDLTFVRPPSWEWVVPEADVRKAHLKIFNANKTKSAEAIFYWFPSGDKQGDPEGCVKRWQMQFRNKDVQATIERSHFGAFKVVYAQIEGIYKGWGKESLSLNDYALLGAVVQGVKGSVMVRMTGPKDLVHDSTTKFKKMIEDALKED